MTSCFSSTLSRSNSASVDDFNLMSMVLSLLYSISPVEYHYTRLSRICAEPLIFTDHAILA